MASDAHRRPSVAKARWPLDPISCQVCGTPTAVVILSFPSSNIVMKVPLCAPCKKALKGQL
jgi:hypothetical protein